MSIELYLAFIAAVVILMAIPGPNVALIVANSVAHGTRFGLLTVAATSSAVVAYLIYLGISAWRAPVADLAHTKPQARSARLIFARGLLVGLTNPKTLLFYGAFFPQFITPGPDAGHQLLLLAVTFLAVAIVCDSGWAILAGRLRALLVARARLRNRITGGLLVGAGLGLAMARRSS